ncbi:MAG: hypothetical protein ABI759_01240 [Candidatus Solibacter sp.]
MMRWLGGNVLAVALVCSAGAWGQSEFWGELKAGKYSVGFRTLYLQDAARSYDTEYAPAGTAAVKKPRPLFVAIWYPSTTRNDAAIERSMMYRDYLRAISVDSPSADFAARLRRHTRDATVEYMLGKEFDKLGEEERAEWEGLQATPVFAVSNVAPAPGKFPVVIHHPGLGGSYEDNAVACEYLASHGYVVLSSAYQAADSSLLNITSDLATSLEDLNFLLRYAGTLPYADVSKVGAMGHSYGAQAMLGWRAQPNSAVDAVVFLDSTVVYQPLDEFPGFKAALEQNRKSAAPVLFVADARRQPRFETFDPYLGYAPRYEATVEGLEHNDFVSQGAIRKSEAVRKNYESVCRVMVQFFDAHLKGDAGARAALRSAGGPLVVKYKEGRDVPPTGAQIAQLYTSEAPRNLQVLNGLVQSIDAELLSEAADLLDEQGKSRESIGLLTWAVSRMPKSALLRAALGESAATMGDKSGARKHFETALELMPDDHTLEASEKLMLSKKIETAILALRK